MNLLTDFKEVKSAVSDCSNWEAFKISVRMTAKRNDSVLIIIGVSLLLFNTGVSITHLLGA